MKFGDFNHAGMEKVSMIGAYMPEANFVFSNVIHSDLTNVNLKYSDMTHVNLESTDLSHGFLRIYFFINCSIKQTVLKMSLG